MKRAWRPDTKLRQARRWCLACLITLVVNTGFIFAIALLSIRPSPLHATRAEAVSLRTLSAADWATNRMIRDSSTPRPPSSASSSPAAPPDPAPKPEPKRPTGQIVDVAPGNQKAPEKARFVAETANTVEKETASRYRGPPAKNVAPSPTAPGAKIDSPEGTQNAPSPVIAGNRGKGEEPLPAAEGKTRAALEIPSTQEQEALAVVPRAEKGGLVPQRGSDELVGNSDRLKLSPETGGDREARGSLGRRGEGTLSLMPSSSVIGRIVGTPSADWLDGVEEGDATFLNTKEWRHATYFTRISREVGSYWRPRVMEAVRTYDPSAEAFLYKDRRTILSITLDSSGSLLTVTVSNPSGADFLDREAIAAFERAERFPNPPSAIKDPDGMVRFNFAFVVTNGGPRFKLFR